LSNIIEFNNSLRLNFGIKSPRIAVLGLNPHAGENGSIGDEEINIIGPAVKMGKENGIDVDGPFPADGFFGFGDFRNYDGVLSMYHDQGLIPLKLFAEGGGVNFTSGLSIIRTSPDHGTAMKIAGKNIASYKSLSQSIEYGIKIKNNRLKDGSK
jgi:4-hydroxy-L-threonine phosphate dehydrogenase PdxA